MKVFLQCGSFFDFVIWVTHTNQIIDIIDILH